MNLGGARVAIGAGFLVPAAARDRPIGRDQGPGAAAPLARFPSASPLPPHPLSLFSAPP